MNSSALHFRRDRSYWFLIVVTAVNLLTSVGFATETLVSASSPTAGYALIRAGALVVLFALALVLRFDPRATLAVAAVAAGVQASDAVVGLLAGDVSKTAGPALIAVITAATAVWFARHFPRSVTRTETGGDFPTPQPQSEG